MRICVGLQAVNGSLGRPSRHALDLHHYHPKLVLLGACSPYRYGYVTELRASRGFRYDNVKHYSMGRLAHEMGCPPKPLHQPCCGPVCAQLKLWRPTLDSLPACPDP